MKMKYWLLSALLLLPTLAVADEHAEEGGPAVAASRTVEINSVVLGVDTEAKTVTIAGENDEPVTLNTPHAQRLDEINVGDEVMIELHEAIALFTMEAHGMEPEAGEAIEVMRAPDDMPPAGMVRGTRTVTASIEAIDLEANTFTLKGPQGNSETFNAQNPENLKKVNVGDLLVVVYTESIAAAITHQAGE